MMTGAISNAYDPYSFYTDYRTSGAGRGKAGAVAQAQPLAAGLPGTEKTAAQPMDNEHRVKGGYRSSPADCETCRERKYQDGSDEPDVSFKSPGHISPQASASVVMAHEQQHVSNAYEKAAEKDGRVISSSVSLRTAVCPECGTVYVSGGTTSTAISYPDESNPYQQNKKAQDAVRLIGANIDYAA